MSARLACLLVLAGGCRGASGVSVVEASAKSARALTVIEVVTKTGARHPVRVALAVTEAEQRRGLMQRRQLGADEGMLFVFPTESRQSFWMRDTLLPLDMVFARGDGHIAGIVANAAPLTDTPRGVEASSRYVLEVNGGWCARHGVAAGDRLELTALPAATR
jgi:uncharacterized membrane protein (UPF0127 family)